MRGIPILSYPTNPFFRSSYVFIVRFWEVRSTHRPLPSSPSIEAPHPIVPQVDGSELNENRTLLNGAVPFVAMTVVWAETVDTDIAKYMNEIIVLIGF